LFYFTFCAQSLAGVVELKTFDWSKIAMPVNGCQLKVR